jgi:hypothetical protein
MIFKPIKAIGSRNAAKSMQKEVEGQVMQLKALYLEKQMELERYIGFLFVFSFGFIVVKEYCTFPLRLRKQYDSLVKKEAEQTEFIQHFTAHK